MASGKYRLIAWPLVWMYLTLSAAGEGLHRLPGMGHSVYCGRVPMWVGAESSGGRAPSLKLRIAARSSRIRENSGGRDQDATLANAPNCRELGYAQIQSPASALAVHCSACLCPRPSRISEDQEPSAEPISAGSVQPDGCCPICSYLGMGKWFAATQERIWMGDLVAIATTWRMDRPDTKAHWGMLARGPPRKANMDL